MPRVAAPKSELMTAIRGLSAARDLPTEVILDALRAALVSAYHKIPDAEATNVTVDIGESTGETRVFSHYAVVEEQYIEDPHSEITPEKAREVKPDAVVGDVITVDVTPRDFGRIAAQTAKQVILQRIREAEREQTFSTYSDREGEIVYGTIQTVTRDYATIALDRVEAILPKAQQIPGERYSPNQRIRVYVSEVRRSPRGPQVVVSRTHREMLHKLMELEIPEIFQGVVEIKAIAREAGSRSKVAVWSGQTGVDPVGACVGMRGVRIQALVRELGGEKIDIVEWDADPRVFIAHALSPSKALHVWLEEDGERRTANVVVPDTQLSLAIGREGQNARLAAKLTGWRIDIRSESEAGDVLDQLKLVEREKRHERERRIAAEAEAVAAALAEAAVVDAVAAGAVAAPGEAGGPTVLPIGPSIDTEVLAPAALRGQASEITAPEISAPGITAPKVIAPEITAPKVEPLPVAPAPGAPDPARDKDEKDLRWLPPLAPLEPIDDDELGDLDSRGRKRKGKQLVRDPKTGKLEAQHERKGSRSRPSWEEEVGRWSDEEVEDSLGFTEFDFLSEEDDEPES